MWGANLSGAPCPHAHSWIRCLFQRNFSSPLMDSSKKTAQQFQICMSRTDLFFPSILKGTVSRDFRYQFFVCSKESTWTPHEQAKTVSPFVLFSRRCLITKLENRMLFFFAKTVKEQYFDIKNGDENFRDIFFLSHWSTFFQLFKKDSASIPWGRWQSRHPPVWWGWSSPSPCRRPWT